MGNKLKNIKQANLLLERRFLQEQSTSTGTTQTTGATQTTGTTQTTTKIPSPKPTTEKQPSIEGITEKDIKDNKYPKCVGQPSLLGKVGNYSLHNNNGSICVG